ncbi:MAG: hypothetical protein IE909_01935 [Campylobacterales bacterium]|nr:hypothetical protein [Campylobacterales bacterium]
MKVSYSGPRPSISQHGIVFHDGKEDKYVYLIIALQILNAIDKDYEEHKSYSYDTNTKRLSDDEMIAILTQYDSNLEKIAEQEALSYQLKLDEEEQEIALRKDLEDVERTAWINNLKIMREYRIQRAVNKIYYMHAVEYIANVIKREHIKEIDTPFYEKYWHVLQTIEGKISSTKSSLHTDLKVERNKDGKLIAKLFIIGY